MPIRKAVSQLHRKGRIAAVSRLGDARCQISEDGHEPRSDTNPFASLGMIVVRSESVKLGKNQGLRDLFRSAKRFLIRVTSAQSFRSMLA